MQNTSSIFTSEFRGFFAPKIKMPGNRIISLKMNVLF